MYIFVHYIWTYIKSIQYPQRWNHLCLYISLLQLEILLLLFLPYNIKVCFFLPCPTYETVESCWKEHYTKNNRNWRCLFSLTNILKFWGCKYSFLSLPCGSVLYANNNSKSSKLSSNRPRIFISKLNFMVHMKRPSAIRACKFTNKQLYSRSNASVTTRSIINTSSNVHKKKKNNNKI